MKNNIVMGQFNNMYVVAEELNTVVMALRITGNDGLANRLAILHQSLSANLEAVSSSVADAARGKK